MDRDSSIENDIIYRLNDNPPLGDTLFAALQHILAAFVGLVTPAIVISGALGLTMDAQIYLINTALFVAGVTTFIQVKTIGPIGSGLLALQGTSFAFLSTILAIGFSMKAKGASQDVILSTIFGVAFACSFVEIFFSRFIKLLRTIISPLVSGIVVLLIGLSTIKVGFIDMMGGNWVLNNKPEAFGNPTNILLGSLVLVIILLVNRSKNKFLRMGAIMIGLVSGYIVASFMGLVDFSRLSGIQIINIPVPFKFGFFKIDWSYVLPMSFLFLITTVETMGDLTATSMNSGEPIKGDLYVKRIAGGVMGDGVSSAIASIFGSFPHTTFSQNNGVILLTGVGSRKVGLYLSGILVLLGFLPIIGGLFSIIPNAVLGGATLVIFGTIAVSGIRIISTNTIDRRAVMIIGLSLGLGMGVAYEPLALQYFPDFIRAAFSSAITTGGLTAIVLNFILPQSYKKQKASSGEEIMKDMV